MREKLVAFFSTSRFPRHVIFILIVLGSRISSSHFHLFFFVPSLCIVCRDVNRCALLVFRPSWKHFRAVCFPFETQSGLLLSSGSASSFSRFAPFLSRLPRGSCCTGLRMLLESCSLRCCLHVFCRVEFPTSRSFPMRLAARGFPGRQACGG